MKEKYILLDRDNTINEDPGYINDASKVKLLPNVVSGLTQLKNFNYKFAIITNQSGVGRGLIKSEELEAVNERLLELLIKEEIRIEKIYICPHVDEDNCDCRKPKNSLHKQALRELDFDKSRSYLIGDRFRDIKPGESLDIRGILVGKSEKEDLSKPDNLAFHASNMKEACDFILQQEFEKENSHKFFFSYKENIFLDFLKNLKDEKKKIVFTNGCFDILHPGHLQYLWQAANLADVLIVGLNTDESVKKLKGSKRPVNTLKDRMLMLSNLPYVTAIVPFAEDTPVSILETIRPAIHVKGGDYEAEKLPEYLTIKKHDGRVVILPFRKGYSTTGILEKVKE